MQDATDLYYFQCIGFNGKYWTFWFYHAGPNVNSNEWIILDALPEQAKMIQEHCKKPDYKVPLNLTFENGGTLTISQGGMGLASVEATEPIAGQTLSLKYLFDLSIYDVMFWAIVYTPIKLADADETLEQLPEPRSSRNLAKQTSA
jgi:hypothetical protein